MSGAKPRLLDLFCGAGGAAMGYHLAGFDVVGIDVAEQPLYPFEFIRGDALEYCDKHGHRFDVIHASPPCQRYSRCNRGLGNTDRYPDLVRQTRDALVGHDGEWILENVEGAPLMFPFTLCGSMFGLGCDSGWLRRHRLFECSRLLLAPSCQHPRGMSIGVYGNGTNAYHREKLGRNITTTEQRIAMGIDWMPRKSLTQAIPPAYTKWIGRQLIATLNQRRGT